MNTAEVAGPGPSLVGRKVSAAFSETDSGVDVETEGEESLEAREEKRVIRPSDEVISRLCNFDEEEEEEEEMTDTESDEADSEAEDTVRLSLMELKHIMSALVHEYVEVCGNISFIMLESVICQILSVESGKISPNAHYNLVRVWSEQLVVAGWAGRRRYPGRVAVRGVSPGHLLPVAGDGRQVRGLQLPGLQALLHAGNCSAASSDTCFMHSPCVPPYNTCQHSSSGGTQHCSTAGDRDGWCSVLGLGPAAARAIANINCCALHSACSVPAAHC